MKTRNLMVAVLLTAGSFTMSSFAQDNIKALIQKCENMDDVEANIIRNKDGKKHSFRTSIELTLNYTPALEKELVDAFHKDEDKATRVMESKKGGKMTDMMYEFENGKVRYTFNTDNNKIQIMVIER